MIEELLPTRLRVLRAERGLTLRAAAKLTGVAKETLSALERGQRHPHDPTLAKIAKGYGVPVEDLLGGDSTDSPVEEPANPKVPEPLPFEEPQEETSVERRPPLTQPWKAYMVERARQWEQITADPDELLFRNLVAAIFWCKEVERENLVILESFEPIGDWLVEEGWEKRMSLEDVARGLNDLAEGLEALMVAVARARQRVDKELEAADREVLEQAEVIRLKADMDKLTHQRQTFRLPSFNVPGA